MRISANPLHDEKCLELADLFLPPTKIERDRQSLASAIQSAIDGWLLNAEAIERISAPLWIASPRCARGRNDGGE